MNATIIILLSLSFITFLSYPALAYSDNVIISELDTNPSEDSKFGSDWVELHNPTDSPIHVGSWQVVSESTGNAVVLPIGTIILPDAFLLLSYPGEWFANIDDAATLLDGDGTTVDATPTLSDVHRDSMSWQQISDGDSDAWRLVPSTPNLPHAKMHSPIIELSLESDKDRYVLGENVTLTGTVSEPDTSEYFTPEPIILTISGPDYHKTETFYPDMNDSFETTIKLRKVLGTGEGTYTGFASYLGIATYVAFSVSASTSTPETYTPGTLSLYTDKSEYIPAQTVKITGQTSKVIPSEVMQLRVHDPSGDIITSGTLIPVDGQFSTTVFLNPVNPAYGTYSITGTYFDQVTTIYFELISETREAAGISLQTDRQVYGLGDMVIITGRLNDLWSSSLNLDITQTTNTALDTGGTADGSPALKVQKVIRPDGDGRFEHSLLIPDAESRLGSYLVKVSQDIGTTTVSFTVADDPSTGTVSSGPLSLLTDMQSYNLGDQMTVSGKIDDSIFRQGFSVIPVNITITDNDGAIIGPKFTAIPDPSGRFSLPISLSKAIYNVDSIVIDATYLSTIQSTTVQLVDSISSTGTFASIDKQVYGLGETVNLTGILPSTGENAVTITLTTPDGRIINSGARTDNQTLSWQWTTPISQTTTSLKGADDRSTIGNNIGVYKIHVSHGPFSQVILFKVSPNPQDDTLPESLFVSAERPSYAAGDTLKITGFVIPDEQNISGLILPERVAISVISGSFPYKKIYESFVYPKPGGEFESTFALPVGIFGEGQYTIKAQYSGDTVTSTFDVSNDLIFGTTDDVDILLSTDQSRYHPGQTVTVTGKLNKMIYIQTFDVEVIKRSDNQTVCGDFICGMHSDQATNVIPLSSGTFTYEYTIDDSDSGLGIYEIMVDADFVAKSITFDVIPRPDADEPPDDSYTVIEKVNRISDSHISILTATKEHDGATMYPRVLSGSLITPSPSDQSSVNIMLLSELGTCVIGQNPDCLVRDSTRDSGKIYDTVDVDGIAYDVRYSGPDVRVEKFDILPASLESLPDATWSIEILKDQQVSRLYYKINYDVIR